MGVTQPPCPDSLNLRWQRFEMPNSVPSHIVKNRPACRRALRP